MRGGLLMGHEPDLGAEALSSALRTLRPTYLYAVPSLLEKIYKNFLRASQQAGRGALFGGPPDTARHFAAAVERQRLGRGSGPGLDLRLQHARHERTVYRRPRAALGGRVRRATSGGSTLSREPPLFYEGIGIDVHDGYGLTETSGGVTMQPLGREKSGTVGQALPGARSGSPRTGRSWCAGRRCSRATRATRPPPWPRWPVAGWPRGTSAGWTRRAI
ncbi:hypothetical protein SHIRM173S_08723 [Streptomyces hirsutus]